MNRSVFTRIPITVNSVGNSGSGSVGSRVLTPPLGVVSDTLVWRRRRISRSIPESKGTHFIGVGSVDEKSEVFDTLQRRYAVSSIAEVLMLNVPEACGAPDTPTWRVNCRSSVRGVLVWWWTRCGGIPGWSLVSSVGSRCACCARGLAVVSRDGCTCVTGMWPPAAVEDLGSGATPPAGRQGLDFVIPVGTHTPTAG
jgi:hypothetical protein